MYREDLSMAKGQSGSQISVLKPIPTLIEEPELAILCRIAN